MKQLSLEIRSLKIKIKLKDTLTSKIISNSLPIKSKVQKWGDEIYFTTYLNIPVEANAKSVVELGEIAFWTEGSAIAIGYGKTPISNNNEIRLISPCNIWGKAKLTKKMFDDVKENDEVILDWDKT